MSPEHKGNGFNESEIKRRNGANYGFQWHTCCLEVICINFHCTLFPCLKKTNRDTGELESIFKDLRWKCDAKTLNDAIKILDKDASGTIEWEEFLQWAELSWKLKVYYILISLCIR